jgi:hypothetical protein
MVIRRLPAELADVVRRAAHYPHGLGFLHQGWIDSVAVTLGVHPFAVDATRALLDTPRGRVELIEAVRRERVRPRGRPAACHPNLRTLHDCEQRARALIEAAREDPRGLEFLRDGPPEAVAADFHVHPYLVFRARGLLGRGAMLEERDPVPVSE